MKKELVARWCIIERVKGLVGNDIELGMMIPTIKSRASNILTDKGNYVCCHKGSTNKDLHRICRRQYEHPGSAIGYWPERCLGHVYIVLKHVGSARITFIDDIVLYELCMLVTEYCLESRMRSRTWRGVLKWTRHKDQYIGRLYLDIGKVLECIGYLSDHRKGFWEGHGDLLGLLGQRGKHTSPQGAGAPSIWAGHSG